MPIFGFDFGLSSCSSSSASLADTSSNRIGSFHITLGPADSLLGWTALLSWMPFFILYQKEYSSFNPSVSLPKALLMPLISAVAVL